MANQQMLDYIKQQLEQGATKEFITRSLLANGWRAEDITQAFNTLLNPPVVSTPPQPTQPPAPSQTQASPLSASSAPLIGVQNPRVFNVMPQGASVQSSPTQSKPSRRWLTVLLAILVGVLVLGGAAYGYFIFVYEKELSPEEVLERMSVEMGSVTSFEYAGEVNASTQIGFSGLGQSTSSSETMDFNMNIFGRSDISNPSEPKASLVLSLRTSALQPFVPGELGLSMEVVSLGNDTYMKLTQVPVVGLFDLSSTTNQWINLDTSSLAEQFGFAPETLTETASWNFSAEELERVRKTFSRFITVTEVLPDELVDGVDTYHYRFGLNKSGLEPGLDQLASLVGEIWIGKEDYRLYKVSGTLGIRDSLSPDVVSTANFSSLYRNYNVPVVISAPLEVRSLEEVLNELLGGFLGEI